jgi:hypothetical protein
MKSIIKNLGSQFYGDSLTVGYNATSNNGYAQQLATLLGGGNNYAIGHTNTLSATREAYRYLPLNRRSFASYMSGLNDIRSSGANAYAQIEKSHRAFLAACFLKDACPASLMRRTGTWTGFIDSVGSGLGGYRHGGKSYALGGTPLYQATPSLTAHLDWDFYGDNLVVGGFTTNTAGNYQDLGISIDGGSVQTFSLYHLIDDNTMGYDAKIFTGLGAGPHTVRLSPLSTNHDTCIDYVGTLTDAIGSAPAFVSKIPYLGVWTAPATQAIFDAANVIIGNVVAEFTTLGYPVELVDVNAFYSTVNCDTDGIHPKTAGHTQILNAYLDKMTIVTF